MTTITFLSIVFTMIVLYFIGVAIYLITGGKGIKMDYKQFLRNLYQMFEIVLVSTFTAIYILASFVLLLCAMAIDKMGHLKDAKHSITVGLGKYEYIFSTKK